MLLVGEIYRHASDLTPVVPTAEWSPCITRLHSIRLTSIVPSYTDDRHMLSRA